MDTRARGIRRKALQKIAALSVTSPGKSQGNPDLERLYNIFPSRSNSKAGVNGHADEDNNVPLGGVAMNIREFEVLLALCKAAPLLQDYQSAERLATQLAPYTLEAHTQVFVTSPFFREIEPSPIESLNFNLTSALLSLGINHPGLQNAISKNFTAYLDRCQYTARVVISRQGSAVGKEGIGDVEDAINVARVAIALLGFLDAATIQANFWTADERLALITVVKRVLSEDFLVAVETAFSRIRNYQSTNREVKEWKRHVRHYAATGRPLGAMLLQRSFMWLLVATSSLLIADTKTLRDNCILELMMGDTMPRPLTSHTAEESLPSIETMAEFATEEMNKLEDGADYLRIGSAWQQRIAFAVKAGALTCYLNCVTINDDVADIESLMAWLEETLSDPIQMADEALANVVLRSMALVAQISPSLAPNMSRILPRFIVQGSPRGETVAVASTCLAFVLRLLSEDAVITTLYSLGNVLTPITSTERVVANQTRGETANGHGSPAFYGVKQKGSAISLAAAGELEVAVAYGNVIKAIRVIAESCADDKITALAQSMLLQKITKIDTAVDAAIIYEAAVLASTGAPVELKSLLKLYSRLTQEALLDENESLLAALLKTRNYLSSTLKKGSSAYDIYFEYLLETIISRGDVHQLHHTRESDVESAAREIGTLVQPLALLMSANNLGEDETTDDDKWALVRDAWFNMVVHGFTTCTERGRQYLDELRFLAVNSKPLVTEQRGEQLESDIELNSVLRRGMNSEHENIQKRRLTSLIPSKAGEIRSLSYRKTIFLHTAYLVETLRAESGDCTKAMIYFLEPGMRTGNMSSVMEAITMSVIDTYLRKAMSGVNLAFSAPCVAEQLVSIFCGCCHRIERVQQAATACADKILSNVTSALCQRSSLFVLLELLSLMWVSCLEAETDEYEWKSSYTSARSKVTIQLGDNFEFRGRTLNTLYKKAKVWMMNVINIAPLDIKGLLQTYLSEYDDDGAYGHISLGRSFAAEMGGMIPVTDQRLGAIDRHGDAKINAISDFVAQYTTRQEYRYAEGLPDYDAEWTNFMKVASSRSSILVEGLGTEHADALTVLNFLDARMQKGKFIPISELRDMLRRAAAFLCRAKGDEAAVVKHLVGIPFAHFSKQSIKLGISLWQGVINENPRMESRIIMEIAQQWENTIHMKKGVFNDEFKHPDPFFIRKEYAPSDRDTLHKKQQHAQNLLAPHSRLLQFLASHFNATRLCSPHTQKTFVRLLQATLNGLMHSTGHPLSRELRFNIIMLSLKVLRHGTVLTAAGQYRLKNQMLSAALSWFSFAPCFTFGGNRLQLKAEAKLLSDVAAGLDSVGHIGAKNASTLKRLQDKEVLLFALLENEQSRLRVWLDPFAEGKASQHAEPSEATLARLVNTAWFVSPSLAISLVTRFHSARVHTDVRNLLLADPLRGINDPEGLNILMGREFQSDLKWQLKYLLFWTPVNPVTAVTYFLPSFSDNPFIIQYAMRALESHSVEVAFFYVPQIVQSLRYDTLGYVERYIVETAQFSQLFAHQIIWNMKANSYKDEDSQIPDGIKPALDHVMARMISCFTVADRDFYEREFTFFDEVTSISGKLKPFIKRSKPEKKQKIEEELRKIKVDVGVYLPINPDGVVIGIDRKSGKPLQSHAKAPYMATFRIKKDVAAEMEETEDMLEAPDPRKRVPENSIEVWQSVIFKVGDDCRQDVLALQMIAAFRGIFSNVGLDVYVFPNRVTATAPGCGIIEVLPNSVSRDMLGREAVNGLYDYFVSKYGTPDSVRFQAARSNFVKSVAAYSIISFLLQFKDRHNGNIMIDDAGHILHIDFGFCFDIAPGGVRFERAPFKLTAEMVAVMGGSSNTQSYRWFEELCVKAFLAARRHVDALCNIVRLMLDSGLPCFKPESLKHFRERFVLEKTERDAAVFVRGLVRRSHNSYSTGVYDQFQLMTNGIPY
ncbi:hypothetical protein VE02_09422 [Pseudogymnoascus sp. 03VT05]|nr:hypothetical protein VE02_09422 [Pseudogymnoascus sp. 03VT05]